MKVACVLLPDFEVAVELSRHPELAGRPVVVGGLPHERKSVLSCSPEAAAFGITAGMPLRKAAGLSPEAVFLPLDEHLYQTVMATVLEILDAFSPKVEVVGYQPSAVSHQLSVISRQLSANRTQNPGPRTHHSSLVVYLDASGLELLFGPDEELGERMAAAVELRAGLRPRVGMGGSKFVAYVAAMMAPAGSAVVVRPGEEISFLAPLPVEWIPSSQEMQRRLRLFGLRAMGQLAALPAGVLGEQFGPEGMEAARLARGIDDLPVVARKIPTVLQEDVEIDPPTDRSDLLIDAARYLARALETRMRARYLACMEVGLDLGFENGISVHLSTALHEPTDSAAGLRRAVERLLGRAWAQLPDYGEGAMAIGGEGECLSALSPRSLPPSPADPPCDGRPTVPTGRPQGCGGDGPAQREGPRALPPYSGAEEAALPVPQSPHPHVSPSPPLVSLLRLSISGFGGPQGEQLELFGSRAAGLKKAQRAVQQAEELFGKGAIGPMTSAREKPAPMRIKVIAEVEGEPFAFFLNGKREKVREVSNRWRMQEEWWRRERIREYYRVITESGRLCLIFQDLLGGGWFLERVYD